MEQPSLPAGEEIEGAWILLSNMQSDDPSHFGCGWTFEIDRVETEGGISTIYLKEEHGLEIHPGTAEEWHVPHRIFNGPTSYRIYPATSTQGPVRVSPSGGAFLGTQTVSLTTPAVSALPQYSLDGGQTWITGTSVQLSSDCSLWFRSVDPNGIKIADPRIYEFTAGLEPSSQGTAGLSTGMIRERRSSMNGEIEQVETVMSFGADTFVKDEVIPHGTSSWFTYKAYLAVPTDDIYASSAESVGTFRLGQPAKCVIQGDLDAFVRPEPIRSSDSQFCSAV